MTSYINPSTRHAGVQQIVVPDRLSGNPVDDAPFDDAQYVRVNGEWVPASTPEIVPDLLAPSPPTNLLSVGAIASSGNEVNYTLSWAAPTTNTDATLLGDLSYYVVRWRYSGAGAWTTFISNDPAALLPGLPLATTIEWAVLARDLSGNDSTWATDTDTGVTDTGSPEQPSNLVLTSKLGTVTVAWDGLDAFGAPPPKDFSHLAVYMSATTGGPWTFVDRLSGAGTVIVTGVSIDTVRYFTTISVDNSGNESVRSAQASITVVGVTGPDIEANAVTTNKLEAGAVTAVKIAANAITADKIDADAINGKVITGTILQTAASGRRWVLGGESERLASWEGGEAEAAGLLSYTGPGNWNQGLSGHVVSMKGMRYAGERSDTPPWVAVVRPAYDTGFQAYSPGTLETNVPINAPRSMQRGSFSSPAHVANGGGTSGTINFPGGRMAAAPSVTMTAGSSRLTCSVSAITDLGFDYYISNWSPGASSLATTNWIALC